MELIWFLYTLLRTYNRWIRKHRLLSGFSQTVFGLFVGNSLLISFGVKGDDLTLNLAVLILFQLIAGFGWVGFKAYKTNCLIRGIGGSVCAIGSLIATLAGWHLFFCFWYLGLDALVTLPGLWLDPDDDDDDSDDDDGLPERKPVMEKKLVTEGGRV